MPIESHAPTPQSHRSLTHEEINRAMAEWPAILNVHEAARMLRIAPSTLYHHVALGRYRQAINGTGKPLRFWRDRLVREFFHDR